MFEAPPDSDFFYNESRKREVTTRPIYECRIYTPPHEEHDDVCEGLRTVVLHEVDQDVYVCGREGLHDHLETREDLSEDRTAPCLTGARDKRNDDYDHACAVGLHVNLVESH
jgi:hypothetical protein